MSHLASLISAMCLTFVATNSAALGATTGYDPLTNERPDDVDAGFVLAGGDDPITSVTDGIAEFPLGGGDGYWGYADAGFSAATGWTIDTRIDVSADNSASQYFSVVIDEPGEGLIQLRASKGSVVVYGEGSGPLGGTVPVDLTGEFHVLRLTRSGDNVRLYVDDAADPLVDATYSISTIYGGNRLLFGKVDSGTSGLYEVDYINVDTTQAIQEAPIPEPATAGLLALGGVMTLLRRRRR